MEKILFVNPSNVTFDDFINIFVSVLRKGTKYVGDVFTDMPLGIISMSAYFKKHLPVETKLVDLNIVFNKQTRFDYLLLEDFFYDVFLSSDFRDYAPTIVGISVLFVPAYHNYDILPEAIIIAGGCILTRAYKNMTC